MIRFVHDHECAHELLCSECNCVAVGDSRIHLCHELIGGGDPVVPDELLDRLEYLMFLPITKVRNIITIELVRVHREHGAIEFILADLEHLACVSVSTKVSNDIHWTVEWFTPLSLLSTETIPWNTSDDEISNDTCDNYYQTYP